MKDLMIDLETMGNSSNAAIVAIGACFFEPSTGEIGATFSRIISLESSQKCGCIDASTVLWWMKQSSEARAVLNSPEAQNINLSLHEFREFVNSGSRQPLVWGNGSSFDCVILKNTIIQCLGEQYVPWQFWNERDVRTMVDLGKNLLGFDPKRDMPFEGIRHDALSDAVHQAKYVSAIYQRLAEKAKE
ncbi:3'-5' exonuclease [Vibrio cholerae]|uniref:3'-5' exonuclease n=1 Tax=Vibrio cholerae TaxID=666 RepID=UPI0006E509BF|nr:3'-5' exonuclease [Vibrio cholerae]KQA29319.1 ATPase [Vibrio paracholerae 877-163]EKS2824161.1 3'-5' exoribonuclease [Vibrio cholerae]ELF5299023.1 3'-5' exoribonuclease [Vibrio cholerae]MDV2323953.1 3'-5' exonuclease [Vibrio cholerae]HDZ9676248.1 3'-5' exoribonuclease [Vibrio cholerae]